MLAVVCLVCSAVVVLGSNLEPHCVSNYDFLEKMLEKVVRFEHKIALMEESMKRFTESTDGKITAFTESVNSKIDIFNKKSASSSGKISKFVNEHGSKMADMEKTLETTIETSNQTLNGIKERVSSEIQSMIEHTYKKIGEAKDSLVKKDVVFQVKYVSQQPSRNSIIKFSTIVTNTDDVFNVDSGHFTAPLSGTYWFAVQMCTDTRKLISPTIYINDQLVNRAYIRDVDFADCDTVTAVAVLKVGDKVCVKAGPNMSGGNVVWDSPAHNLNTFMGALVN